MKKYLWYGAGGLAALRFINDEVLSWIVIAVAVVIILAKIFPDMMEGTK